jgi:hypothetical protein
MHRQPECRRHFLRRWYRFAAARRSLHAAAHEDHAAAAAGAISGDSDPGPAPGANHGGAEYLAAAEYFAARWAVMNGDGVSDFHIVLNGTIGLVVADFIL